jgi:hypothetical protein
MSDFRTRRDGDHPPEIVLGFGDLAPGAIERGIAIVGDLLGGAA